MRRLLVTLALVFVVAAIEVETQEHGGHAAPDAKSAATPAAHGTAATPAAHGTAAAPKADVASVLERINKKVATEVSDLRRTARRAPARPPAHASPAAAPRTASRASLAPARVELDWHTPLLVWPDELLRPDRSAD
jgi:hypothetical protein